MSDVELRRTMLPRSMLKGKSGIMFERNAGQKLGKAKKRLSSAKKRLASGKRNQRLFGSRNSLFTFGKSVSGDELKRLSSDVERSRSSLRELKTYVSRVNKMQRRGRGPSK